MGSSGFGSGWIAESRKTVSSSSSRSGGPRHGRHGNILINGSEKSVQEVLEKLSAWIVSDCYDISSIELLSSIMASVSCSDWIILAIFRGK